MRDDRPREIFISDDYAEALLKWSDQLSALGRMLVRLGEHQDPDLVFTEVASQMGEMIEDYANSVHHVCEQAYGVLSEFFHDGHHILVSRAKDTYKRSETMHPCPAAIVQIDECINEIKPVLMDAATLSDILRGLEKNKKAIEEKLKAS